MFFYGFWLFLLYSLGGYVLEKLYAAVRRPPHRVRKCFLLLPLCPVYGLAMLAVLGLPPDMTGTFWRLALYGGLTATAVEYVVHLLYEKLLGVMFWDYSATKMDLNRRVCVPFALVWGPLTALTVRYVHPWVSALARSMPPAVTCAVLLLFVADCFLSARVLRRSGDIDLMSLPRLLSALSMR